MRVKIIAFLSALLGVTLVVLLYFVNRKIDQIVVVDVLRVVNEFKLKKDLEQRVEPALHAYANRVDSLEAIYKNRVAAGDEKAVTDALQNHLLEARGELDEVYNRSNQQINEQIWHRLNTLIDEYAAANGYRLIIGANGMGTVLYNEKAIERTDELIAFANSRYERGK